MQLHAGDLPPSGSLGPLLGHTASMSLSREMRLSGSTWQMHSGLKGELANPALGASHDVYGTNPGSRVLGVAAPSYSM